jgi:hypothetical protein
MNFTRKFLPTQLSLKLIVAVFLLISLLNGCTSTKDPPKWEVCEDIPTKTNTIKSDVSTDNHLVVYLDTSASMAGYVSPDGGKSFAVAPDGQTIFSKTLLELRSVVTTLSPQSSVVVRRVDANVSAPSFSNLELSQAAVNRTTYNGKETNLAGAIKIFDQPLTNEDSENKIPARFHILVTDGVQSSNQQNKQTSCEQGSDSVCVNTQIFKLLNAGWSATVLGIKSEFQGNVYSEINKSAIPFSTGKDTSKFRPFYLYIFSPDKNALTTLTEVLRRKLRETVNSEDALREFSLTSNFTDGVSIIETQNLSKELIELRQDKEKEGTQPRISVRVDVKTEREGAKPILLKVKIPWSQNSTLAGNPNELLNLIKWNLELVNADKEEKNVRYPNLKLVKQEIKDGVAEMTFEAGWTKDAGEFGWRMYRLVGKFDTDQSVLPWVKQWSTQVDTTVDVANKTLNLEGSLGNLWKNTSLQNEIVGGACLRVGAR